MLKVLLLGLSVYLFTGCVATIDNNGYMIKGENTKDTRNISQINIVLNEGLLLDKEYLVELSKIVEKENININEKREYKIDNISNIDLNKKIKLIEELNIKNKLNTNLSYREINTIKEKNNYFVDNYITEIIISKN